jgi:hypothetical protein
MLRAPGAIHAAAGALILALPASALAVGVSSSDASNATDAAVPAHLNRHHVGYGGGVDVRGALPAADAGRPLELQFEPSGATAWRTVDHTRVNATGRYRLHAALRHSGLLRVSGSPTAQPTQPARAAATPAPAASGGGAALAPSAPQRVEVGARLRVTRRTRVAVTGRNVTVRGQLLPAGAGRAVALQARAARGWRTVARTRTGARGGFSLRYHVGATGSRAVRVSFGGDLANRGASAPAGHVVGMRYAVVSWYSDGGSTACGFHATYGIASRTLPCGTHVTLSYGGRTVTATVDDRGPYVYSRDYDLNQNVAGALGMGGVATVLASI